MSAPGPRAGSSGRNGRCSNAPVAVLAASRASVPGSEPTPEAAPRRSGKGCGVLTRPSLLTTTAPVPSAGLGTGAAGSIRRDQYAW